MPELNTIVDATREVLDEIGLHGWPVLRAMLDQNQTDRKYVHIRKDDHQEIAIDFLPDASNNYEALKQLIREALIKREPSIEGQLIIRNEVAYEATYDSADGFVRRMGSRYLFQRDDEDESREVRRDELEIFDPVLKPPKQQHS